MTALLGVALLAAAAPDVNALLARVAAVYEQAAAGCDISARLLADVLSGRISPSESHIRLRAAGDSIRIEHRGGSDSESGCHEGSCWRYSSELRQYVLEAAWVREYVDQIYERLAGRYRGVSSLDARFAGWDEVTRFAVRWWRCAHPVPLASGSGSIRPQDTCASPCCAAASRFAGPRRPPTRPCSTGSRSPRR